MRVLVTGATGFLGQYLAQRLHQLGFQVTATGRSWQKGAWLEEKGIAFVAASLEDRLMMTRLCRDKDYVFHCGALSSPWGDWKDFYQCNVVGTKNVIEGCMNGHIKRLIYVSTPSIYFRFQDQLDIKEDDPLPERKVNAYAETKWLAEQAIDQAYQQGLPVITIRPRALFGPGDQTIIPRLLKANEQRFIPLINEGKVLIDLTYVENVVDALLLCMDSPQDTLGQKYNITNGEPMLFIDLLKQLFSELNQPMRLKPISFTTGYLLAGFLEWTAKKVLGGKEPLLTRYAIGQIGKSQTLDISKARKELGYEPRISIEEGIHRFVEWWKEQS
ncbi:NAD-dependent epimerase/dehydratase family protein [Thermoflavimicrobium dichotomicum]|uniref:Nucleoside-diphosphate-sugar epimerase n=1 Tax=Thermoflavimicrobium dichotomicum TaxID=46223 RepID=A0A1I3JQU5_9BACL|nr:NAD-dependent epimerase/dehydratase family protein [Thermoflavimicrobium dichotomicum]SFI62639.1 Nucleoside-diphosphate-sugar epimerase [Thermoflavimicrobium dichotomicum]